MSDIDDLGKRLREKKEQLEERLNRVEASLRKSHAADWAEQASERENDEVVEALDINIRNELEQINQALLRMDQGSYGTCKMCDGPIRVERLEALPFTDTCFDCASEIA